LKCTFCSCAEREKGLEMPIWKIEEIAERYSYLGCKAVTITGGGEPLLHPYINEAISIFSRNNIKVGLVTNGLLINLLSKDSIAMLEWIRISFDDSRDFREVKQPLDILPHDTADWSFSYVVSREPNIEKISDVVRYACEKTFTHVRLVSDLLDIEHAPDMEDVKAKISQLVYDGLVIYQGRKSYSLGSKQCYISLLKPVVNTDGSIYPCCGAQYALDDDTRAYNEKMLMGDMVLSKAMYEEQAYFDGSKCKKCYYSEYNEVLKSLITKVNHKEFV
jgi:MoaA/NifB/PqqE/SkfB family radical SAM enzyme